jgi:hypothetical protein
MEINKIYHIWKVLDMEINNNKVWRREKIAQEAQGHVQDAFYHT